MNKDLFPKLYGCSCEPESPFWTNSSYTSDADLAIWVEQFKNELVEAKGDVDVMLRNTTAFLEDVIALTTQYPQFTDKLHVIQFTAATELLHFLTSNKLFPYSFDWILNAIDSRITSEKQRSYSLDRLDGFIHSMDPFVQAHFHFSYPKWVHDLFYYSRSTGGHKEAADVFMQNYLGHFCQMVSEQPGLTGVRALAQALSWSHQLSYPDQEKIIAGCLYAIYQQTDDASIKKLIAFQFCVGDFHFTQLSKKEWCKTVEQEYSGSLRHHERMQLLANLYGSDIRLLTDHFDELVQAISEYRQQLPPSSQALLINYEVSRIYGILEKSLAILLQNGQVKKANQLIAALFDIAAPRLIEPDNFYIIPNTRDGVQYCFESDVLHVDADSVTNLPVITDLENKFLGITHTFNDNKDFVPYAPAREGVPDAAYANAFCDALRQHFDFKRLLHKPGIHHSSGYHLFYGGQLPLQNIMATELGFTIPLIHSFQKGLPIRPIKRVYIWEGDTILSGYERIGLEEIFVSSGIEVQFATHADSSKDAFIKAYTDPAYDLIWITCHGQYFHYEPHTSYLDLGSGITMHITELAGLPLTHSDRRLVIVDACDGGTNALANSPLSIGIGSAITGQAQSLLSHGWPVDNYSSMVTGLLLAIFLSQGYPYKEAHYRTIAIIKQGKEAILEFLPNYCHNEELLDRIRYKELDYPNFMYWGSLIYME